MERSVCANGRDCCTGDGLTAPCIANCISWRMYVCMCATRVSFVRRVASSIVCSTDYQRIESFLKKTILDVITIWGDWPYGWTVRLHRAPTATLIPKHTGHPHSPALNRRPDSLTPPPYLESGENYAHLYSDNGLFDNWTNSVTAAQAGRGDSRMGNQRPLFKKCPKLPIQMSINLCPQPLRFSSFNGNPPDV
ncbi:hypothetical protein J6590_027925 [Homalodisca vitripennis]|nr:hypothetical protein J6590_027925 [Homalodisca vitripennis]